MTVVLFLISLLTRLVFLYFGHPYITHDEADYFINSYLLAKTGTDIFGNRLFLTSGILYATSAVPVYLGSILFIFFQKSVIFARLPFAILNSFIPVVFYLILKKLTNNKKLSLLGFTILNFSPWFSYLSSQSAFDSPISLLFYIIAFYSLLTETKPLYKYFLFLVFLFLSFNSYMGIKISFPFLIFIAFLSEMIYQKKKINFTNIIKNIFLSCILFSFLFLITNISPGAIRFQDRLKEKLLPFNTKIISNRVIYERSITNNQSFFKNILFNKLTVFNNLFLEKYIESFNPYFLFVKGDQHTIYGTNYIGLFYIFDFIFLLTGLYFSTKVFQKNSIIVVPFFLLFLAAAIPIGITVDIPNISIRGYPLIIPYIFFISIGAYYLFKKLFKKNFLIFSSILYLSAFIYFFMLFQYAIKNASSNQWHSTEKRLSEKLFFLKLKNPDKKIFVYVNEPRETLLLYLFYEENNPFLIKKSLLDKKNTIGELYFSSLCPQKKIVDTIQIIHSERCPIDNSIFKPTVFVSPENNLSPSYFLLE